MNTSDRLVLHSQFSVDDFNGKLDALWAELLRDGTAARRDAEELGVNLALIDGVKREDAIVLRRDGAGLDPATTAVIVAFAPVAAKITRDLWDHIFLPRILRAWGADSITKPNV